MQIKRIHIQGFKSLEDVIFEPETGFSCLVGSNGAGKSNFCDALLFFKHIILNGIEDTLNNFMPVDLIKSYSNKIVLNILFLDQTKIYNNYTLVVDLEDQAIRHESISLGNEDDNNLIYTRTNKSPKNIEKLEKDQLFKKISFIKEIFEKSDIDEENKNILLENFKNIINHPSVSMEVKVTQFTEQQENHQKLSEDKTALSAYYDKSGLFDFFSQLIVLRVNPLSPKIPTKLFNKSNLLMHGDNLATILAELKKDQDKWQTLHEWLGLIVPSISEVEVKQGEFDSSLSLHFNENGKLMPAISISDGTIYTLSILAAILWNQDKNTLIVIEEPERGIHPQAITELIGFMREATTQNLNIITTTHSETLVRNCKLEELWLVDKLDGKTQLNSAKQQNPHLQEASLDQAWLMNLFNGGLPW